MKEHTTYDLNLPHDAHIPEDMLDDYYEEKADGLTIVEDDYLYKIDLWLKGEILTTRIFVYNY